jgi:hypothetical protein
MVPVFQQLAVQVAVGEAVKAVGMRPGTPKRTPIHSSSKPWPLHVHHDQLLLLDALVDLAILRGRWRRALAVEHAQPAPGPTP